jgi:hypothetical protein
MASSIRRIRSLALAAGLSGLLTMLTVGSAFAGGGTGPW